MTSRKLKAEVRINDESGAGDIDLLLTAEQAVRLLDYVVTGDTVAINLLTRSQINGYDVLTKAAEDPKAYAQ
jgi:hypothetical protein